MSHIPTFFKAFPQEPGELSTSNAIARLIDGLGIVSIGRSMA
jgi:hypothetical protein